ncbi:MAG: hypothetical protein M1561_01030 [Gammaproteobacteria bacterium]|nr:hypothetical protein [Gammaproteobacteria bacterium]
MRKQILSLTFGLFSYSLVAQSAVADLNKTAITLWGFSGAETASELQLLSPLILDQDFVFFGGGEGRLAANKGWLLGIGGGLRKIIKSQIYGGYVFADFNNAPGNNKFWVISPGFESFGENWEGRVNGYIPLKDRIYSSSVDLAENFGIYKYEDFITSPHTIYDHLLQDVTEPAIGFDAEIGRAVPHIAGLKLFVGGYYFHTRDFSNITGCTARISYQLNRYTAFELRDKYDNAKKNQFLIGVKFTLGGLRAKNDSKPNVELSERLLDPIEHNFAVSGNGNSVPLKRDFLDTHQVVKVKDHVWYFDALGSSGVNGIAGDGTFLHPFSGIDAVTLSKIQNDQTFGGAYANFYFNGNNAYRLNGFTNQRFTLPANYNIYGRTTNYLLPATANLRPTFIGGLDLYGNNNLEAIALKNDGTQDAGILIVNNNDVRNVFLNNVLVGENNSHFGYTLGVNGQSSTILTLANSTIYGYSSDPTKSGNGIVINGGTINFLNNNIISGNAEFKNINYNTNQPEFSFGNGLVANNATISVLGNHNVISGNSVVDNIALQNMTVTWASGTGVVADSAHIIISGNDNTFSGKVVTTNATSSGTANVQWFGGSSFLGNGANFAISGRGNRFSGSAQANNINVTSGAAVALVYGNAIMGNGAKFNISGRGNSFSGSATLNNANINNNAVIAWIFGNSIMGNGANFSISGSGNSFSGIASSENTSIDNHSIAAWIFGNSIMGNGATFNISGSGNTFSGKDETNTAKFAHDAVVVMFNGNALIANGAKINLLGSNNIFSGTMQSDNTYTTNAAEVTWNGGNGLIAGGGAINIVGNNNNFTGDLRIINHNTDGTANNTWTGGDGIFANGAMINFIGNLNKAIGHASSDKKLDPADHNYFSAGYGLFAHGAEINDFGYANYFSSIYK